jgi:DNA polymerase ligase (LigD)-like protein
MPRFVLLFHDCPPDFGRASHWDLMLESGGVLRTWALTEMPRMSAPGQSMDTERLADHRLAYLEYEGPVSGERGTVRRVDAGTFETLVEAHDRWEVALSGNVLRGKIALRRGQGDQWTLTVERCD